MRDAKAEKLARKLFKTLSEGIERQERERLPEEKGPCPLCPVCIDESDRILKGLKEALGLGI